MESNSSPSSPELGVLLHQFNNDLSLILGHLDLAVMSAAGNDKLLKRLEASRAATQRMAERVREIQKKHKEAPPNGEIQNSK